MPGPRKPPRQAAGQFDRDGAENEVVEVIVKMPRSLKAALIARSEEVDASVNDVAVGILAARVGFDFHPSPDRSVRGLSAGLRVG